MEHGMRVSLVKKLKKIGGLIRSLFYLFVTSLRNKKHNPVFPNLFQLAEPLNIRRNMIVQNSTIYSIFREPSKKFAEPLGSA